MPGIQIIGAGNNVSAGVSEDGRLKTNAVAIEPEYYSNFQEEYCFYLQITVTPSPSADFLYIKNTDDTPMILENLYITCATDEEIWLYRNPSGTPTDGSETIPANSNFGSSKKADGTFIYGSDLGGLTSSELYNTLSCYADQNNAFTFRNWIIIPKNSTIGFNARNGDIELDISMPFFYLCCGV